MFKKIIGILLIVTMLLSLITAVPAAAATQLLGGAGGSVGGGLVGYALSAVPAYNSSWKTLAGLQNDFVTPVFDSSAWEAIGYNGAVITDDGNIEFNNGDHDGDGTDDTFNESTVGNTVVTDANRDEYIKTLTGYIPVVKSLSDDKADPEGAVAITDINSSEDPANPNCYYLYEDISCGSIDDNFALNADGSEKGTANVIIDGCGRTINLSSNFFNKIKNITVKNITFTGSLPSANARGAILDRWTNLGFVKAYNITVADTFTVENTNGDGSKGCAVLVSRLVNDANGESEFENIYSGARITFTLNKAAPQIEGIGSIVGRTNRAVSFKNCVNNGSITVKSSDTDTYNAFSVYFGIGGIAGGVCDNSGSASFINCVNRGTITVSEGVNITMNAAGGIGGIVGDCHGSSAHKLVNCVSSGNIIINGTLTSSYKYGIGGIIGRTNGSNTTVTNCLNSGNITVNGALALAEQYGLGGIMGLTDNATSYNNCINRGNITTVETATTMVKKASRFGGIMGSCAVGQASTFTNCLNSGDVTVNSELTDVGDQHGVAGIAGGTGGRLTFTNCENQGDLYIRQNKGDWAFGGISGSIKNAALTASYCKNSGTIDRSKNFAGTPVGGLFSSVQPWGSQNNSVDDPHGDVTIDGSVVTDIDYCINTGEVKSSFAGGIFGGYRQDNSPVLRFNLDHCINEGAITGTSYAGGIVCSNAKSENGSWGGNLVINDCLNTGTVTAPVAGGIVGFSTRAVVITHCFNGTEDGDDGQIIPTTPSGENDGQAGGIMAKALAALTIKDCVNNANITINNDTLKHTHVGGIVGQALIGLTLGSAASGDDAATVVVNNGAISVTTANASRDYGVGGIVGCAGASGVTCTLTNCRNNAPVTHFSSKLGGMTGGVLGRGVGTIRFSNCINTELATVTFGCATDGSQLGFGGVLGGIYNDGTVAFEHCENRGAVSVHEDNVNNNIEAGGISGILLNINLSASYCKNSGDVTSVRSGTSPYAYAGGCFAGNQTWGTRTVSIDHCYNTGDVVGKSAGGVFGSNPQNDGNKITTTFDSCMNEGTISGSIEAGGIIGISRLSGSKVATPATLTVSNCFNNGSINGIIIGGIVAFVDTAAVISNCYNGAEVDGITLTATDYNNTQGFMGGIVGTCDASLTMRGCINYAKLHNPYTEISDRGGKHMGGLVGRTTVAPAIIGGENESDRCYNFGSALIERYYNNDHIQSYGGIIGNTIYGATVTNCHNYGDTTVTAVPYNSGIAGIVGVGFDTSSASCTLTVTDCENHGAVTQNAISSAETCSAFNNGVGGIVGLVRVSSSGEITHSVSISNSTNSGAITGTYAGGIMGKSTVTTSTTDCTNSGDINATNIENNAASLGGIIAYVNGASFTASGCTNNGAITVPKGLNMRTSGGDDIHNNALGGIIGWGTNGADIDNCTNSGPISAGGVNYHVGGIIGVAVDGATVDYCVNDGILYINSSLNYRGAGGIIGDGKRSSVTVQYCENNGDILMADGASNAASTYVGGVFGRSEDNCVPTLNFCINNGDIDVLGTRVGGVLGSMQTWESNVTGTITNCVNSGSVSSYQAGGILGFAYPDGSQTTVFTANISDCVNSGAISGTSHAGGIVGGRNGKTGIPLTATINITNCVNLGATSAPLAAGISVCENITFTDTDSVVNSFTVRMNGCISAGQLTGSSAYVISPPDVEADTSGDIIAENCKYLVGIGGSDSYSTVQIADNDALQAELGSIVNSTDNSIVGVLAYKRADHKSLYKLADEVTNVGLYGEHEGVSFTQARDDAEPSSVFANGKTAYFTATQAEVTSAYQTLYAIMYGASENATYQIYIPDSITLEHGGDITGSLTDFTALLSLNITVTGDFTLRRVNGDTDTITYCLVSEGNRVGNGDVLVEFTHLDGDQINYHFDTEILTSCNIPGEYTGSLTFTINYGTRFAESQ